jgi:hypothetical protein
MRPHLTFIVLLAAACGSGSKNTCDMPGGAAQGAADMHCGARKQATSQASCTPADAGPVPDASPTAPDAGPEFGATMFGNEGDDDDCKYHVVWSSTAICENEGITFTLTATNKVTGMPALGADPSIEAFLGASHIAPSTGSATEKGNGVYDIGPVKFDMPGMWTVRFHLYETCEDTLPDSPHGHAAFFVNVP